MDPVNVMNLARIYQQEILDSAARDRLGEPIMEPVRHESVAHLQQQAARTLFDLVQPLHLLLRLSAALVNAVKAVNTQRAGQAVYAADCPEIESECAS